MINFIKKIYYSKYTNKSYSISFVDLVINRIFSKLKNGIYVDLGCNHPIKYNNTYLLYKRGWTGINIDSDETSIKEFNKFRKKDTNINAIVSSKNKSVKYYYYHDRSALNTVDVSLVRTEKKPKKVLIKTTTLNQIIQNSPYKNKKINFLSVDIENHEYEAKEILNFINIR